MRVKGGKRTDNEARKRGKDGQEKGENVREGKRKARSREGVYNDRGRREKVRKEKEKGKGREREKLRAGERVSDPSNGQGQAGIRSP